MDEVVIKVYWYLPVGMHAIDMLTNTISDMVKLHIPP